MTVTIVPLSQAEPAGLRKLLGECWKQNTSEESMQNYFAWRYGGRKDGDTLVACHEGECIGILDSLVRSYRISGRRAQIRETCDWYCRPKYRLFGIGLRLMRMMMAKPEPILVTGGTELTRGLLPRLGWAHLDDVQRFVLPVSMKSFAGLAAHSPSAAALRLVPNWRLFRRRRRHEPPCADAYVNSRAFAAAGEATKMGAYDLAPWLDASFFDWLSDAPASVGEFVVLSFFSHDAPVGMSLSRLQMLTSGLRAQIVHLHPADPAAIDWIIGETVDNLVARGAGAVLCNASCPTTRRALRAFGFVSLRAMPVFWWSADRQPPSGALNLSSLRADDAFQWT
jgi:hypothetical protein